MIEEELLDEFASTEEGKVAIRAVFKLLSKLITRVLLLLLLVDFKISCRFLNQ